MADIDALSAEFARRHPRAFAEILGRGELLDILRVLKHMPSALAASICARLPSSRIDAVLAYSQDATAQWLADASSDDALTLIGRMPRENSLALVNSLKNRERRRKLLQFLRYPTHSVGALVSDVLVRVSADMLALDALEELRALKVDDPGPVVVLHADGRYLGLLDMWRLLARDPPTGVVREYVAEVPAIFPETSLASAALDTNWHQHNWRPVVDHEQRVLGGVTRDRIIGSMATSPAHSQLGQELLTSLVTEMVRILGALLDRVMGGRSAS